MRYNVISDLYNKGYCVLLPLLFRGLDVVAAATPPATPPPTHITDAELNAGAPERPMFIFAQYPTLRYTQLATCFVHFRRVVR